MPVDEETAGAEPAKKARPRLEYDVGEQVRVVNGPYSKNSRTSRRRARLATCTTRSR